MDEVLKGDLWKGDDLWGVILINGRENFPLLTLEETSIDEEGKLPHFGMENLRKRTLKNLIASYPTRANDYLLI